MNMTELAIVRENLMTVPNYTGYCGNAEPRGYPGGCSNPRTIFDGEQFVCPECKWRSQYPEDFITRYKVRWGK